MVKNAWIEYVKANKGNGKSLKELSVTYQPIKELREEIKRRGTCAKEVNEVRDLKRALAVKQRQLAALLN